MQELNQDLVSIIIPAYNAEQWFERTLLSATNQTHSALEVIVVDDGSTDSTRSIASQIAASDPRVKVFSVPNGGVARARNVGLQAAKGQWVAFLDADDLWHPTKIARQMEALADKDKTYAACYTLRRSIDSDDRVRVVKNLRHCTGFILARHLFGKFVGNGSSLLVRAEAARSVGGFDPSYADQGIGGCEDLDFELKLAAQYRFIAVPELLVGYRSYPGNMSSDCRRITRAMAATVSRHLTANSDIPEFAQKMIWASTHHWAATLLWRDRQYGEAASHTWKLLRNDPGYFGYSIVALAMKRLRRWKASFAHKGKPDSVTFYSCDPRHVPLLRSGGPNELRIEMLASVDGSLERTRLIRDGN